MVQQHIVVRGKPDECGTEVSFHSLWDNNIRAVLDIVLASVKVHKMTGPGFEPRTSPIHDGRSNH
jgi:hypothetical protein